MKLQKVRDHICTYKLLVHQLKLLGDNERDELQEQDGVVNIHWINSIDDGVFHIVECFGGFK